MRNYKLTEKIVKIIEKDKNTSENKILELLYKELKSEKITENDKVHFCTCGFPISCNKTGSYEFILELIRIDTEIRSYTEFFLCPNCLHEFERH